MTTSIKIRFEQIQTRSVARVTVSLKAYVIVYRLDSKELTQYIVNVPGRHFNPRNIVFQTDIDQAFNALVEEFKRDIAVLSSVPIEYLE